MAQTKLEGTSIREAYEDVRDDKTDTNWAVFKYDGKSLCHNSSGTDYNEFQGKFTEDERGFGYVRCTTGDELSKRYKFALITWIGENVSPMQRAKISTDKLLVKGIITSFAVEIHPSDADELKEAYVKESLQKAGGANYGTGGVSISAESPPTPPPTNGTGATEIHAGSGGGEADEPEEEPAYQGGCQEEDPSPMDDNGLPESEDPQEMEDPEEQ